jgi:hypothetical protein
MKFLQIYFIPSCLSEAEIAQSVGYRLDGWGSIPGRGRDFSIPRSDQTDSETHPAPYPLGTGVKRQEREADHSPPLLPRSGMMELVFLTVAKSTSEYRDPEVWQDL